jgi:tetratricopeptide (TPR) repeat protein
VEIEPRSPLAHSLLAANLYFARRFADAFASAGRALEIDSRFHLALYWRALAMVSRGLPAAVTATLEALGEPNPPPVVIAALGRARVARGQLDKARQSLELLEKAAQNRHVSATLFAGLHAALDNKDSAIGWLDRAYETRARLLLWTRADPVYDGLHSDSRFQALLAKMKL